MREGLAMVTLPGRYGYSVSLVGYVRHIRGFEFVMEAGHVSLIRTSGIRTLGQVASDGPGDDHRLVVADTAEDLHEFRVRRVRAVNPLKWTMLQKPKDWNET